MNYFAVAGNPISHSLSPEIMQPAFEAAGRNACYTRILANDFKDVVDLVHWLPLDGLNVTAPFKRDCLQLAAGHSDEVRFLGLANTLIREANGQWKAYNTDVAGATGALASKLSSIRNMETLVIGAGGAAAAVVYGLKQAGARITICNRTMVKAHEIALKFGISTLDPAEIPGQINHFQLLVNTTPVFPDCLKSTHLSPEQWLMDAAYKGKPSQSICTPNRYIDGLTWLTAQAQFGFSLFTGKEISRNLLEDALHNPREKNGDLIVLTGPMGSGKSTIGRELAAALNYRWIDLDAYLEDQQNCSVEAIFGQKGEPYFRQIESEALRHWANEKQLVISTGGGVVTREVNRELLKSVHTVSLMIPAQTTVERSSASNRPLLKTKNPLSTAEDLFRERLPWYMESAHMVLNARQQAPEVLASLIARDYESTYGGI